MSSGKRVITEEKMGMNKREALHVIKTEGKLYASLLFNALIYMHLYIYICIFAYICMYNGICGGHTHLDPWVPLSVMVNLDCHLMQPRIT